MNVKGGAEMIIGVQVHNTPIVISDPSCALIPFRSQGLTDLKECESLGVVQTDLPIGSIHPLYAGAS